MIKLKFKAMTKRNKKIITEIDICRLNFNEGQLFGIMTWDDETYFIEELEIIDLEFIRQ